MALKGEKRQAKEGDEASVDRNIKVLSTRKRNKPSDKIVHQAKYSLIIRRGALRLNDGSFTPAEGEGMSNRLLLTCSFVILPLVVVLAGCASSDRDRGGSLDDLLGGIFGGGGERVAYRCDDDRRFTVSFDRRGRYASVYTRSRTYELRATDDTGDHREYRGEGGDVRLEVDGDRAELSIDGEQDYEDCEER